MCEIVSLRLKSVKNIQKITKSMKMVAAAKYARAERELKPARTFGQGSLGERMCVCVSSCAIYTGGVCCLLQHCLIVLS